MSPQFFTANRKRLAEQFDQPIILAGYAAMQRKGDAASFFDQEANFWYLTGIEEPDWQLIIVPDGQTILVAPQVSAIHQIFEGGLAPEHAIAISGADQVIGRQEARALVKELAQRYRAAVTLGKDPRAIYYDFVENPAPQKLFRSLKREFAAVEDCRLALAKLRALKQPAEIEAIQQAIDITAKAFGMVKSRVPDLKYEYEVEAEFTYAFRRAGAEGHAYDPIVAAGKNACTLHYQKNNSSLARGFLLLDIGARYRGYAADITRTYAVGTPTEREQAVHAAVAKAHQQIIGLLRPGLSVREYHEQVDVIMKDSLKPLGLLKAESDYRNYFPHAISHGLGIDVHDSLGAPEIFQPGMVLTVEPGIYIPEEAIGIRIEDDILITEDGHRNLSEQLSIHL